MGRFLDAFARPQVVLLASLIAVAIGAVVALLTAPTMVQSAIEAAAPPAGQAPPKQRPEAVRVDELLGGVEVLTPMAPPRGALPIRTRIVKNHNRRPNGMRPVAIVMHATGSGKPGSSFQDLSHLRRHFNGRAEVSAHYGVDRDGSVMQYVPDNRRAWHTAAKGWNDVSIGIELINDNSGSDPFPKAQVDATRTLVQALGEKHDIPVEYVIRHRDVQPWDRSDPASNFPWKEFRRSLVR